jgi:thioredoxin-like negative regulator of GroEL
MRPIIQGLQSEISVTFIDTNASPQTTKTWNVRSVPTTIVVKNGREIGRLVGVKVANEVRALYNR